MTAEFDKKLMANVFANPFGQQLHPDQFALKFEIRREHIVEDALNALTGPSAESLNFNMPIRVVFAGEPGQDEGGVQKEFFQLLIHQLINPDFAMFTQASETNYIWFNGRTFEPPIKYQLIGTLMGLAIYNGILLDLPLPLAAYKKLLDLQPELEDLRILMPQETKSYEYILKCTDEDLEDKLCTTFSIEQEVFGETQVIELVEGGSELLVNQDNKREFVQLVVDHHLNEQCEDQFIAFKRGFDRTIRPQILELLRPEELQQLVCGSQELDFNDLEQTCRYVDGYTEESPQVKWLWEIVIEEMTEDQQKLFLQFATGSDRAPVNGLSTLPFYVGRLGPDSERLPIASTCFNHLMVPEYGTKDKMRAKLMLAIQNAEGFGMI